MFIASVFPNWGFVAAGILAIIVFVVALIIVVRDGEGVLSGIGYGIFSSIVSIGFVILTFLMVLSPFAEQTFSNPHNEPRFSAFVSVNKESLNDTIAETIGADKVSINVKSTRSHTVELMKEGDIFDFTAIDEGSKINGSFYFTEDSLEIIVEDEQQVKQEYSINTNE